MRVERLELKNYRNYETLDIQFDEGSNILYGDNAQGKTNILEALYLCSMAKSHRGTKDRDMIRFEEDEAHLKLIVRKRDVPYRIDMHLKRSKSKGIAVNGMPIRKISELFGIINVIFFSPEDLSIIKNGPSERRKFLDMELCQIDSIYLHHLSAYNKILNQRNKLLKDLSIHFDSQLFETLDIWDMQLSEYGNKIIERREQFIQELNEIIKGIHGKLTGGKEIIEIRYEPDVKKGELLEVVRISREKDIRYKMTGRGPHRDDMGFYVQKQEKNIQENNKLQDSVNSKDDVNLQYIGKKEKNGKIDLRKFGSQGQQRTAALSLKLSEIELVKKIIKDEPVLLLDDVMSELDSNRQNYLIDSIHDIQTILTCTGLDEMIGKRMQVNRIYRIVNGTASLYETGKEQQ